jgi:hypothetical protein
MRGLAFEGVLGFRRPPWPRADSTEGDARLTDAAIFCCTMTAAEASANS